MYIPSTFMSTQGSCFTVTTSAITGSGLITSGSFISASQVYDWYKFEMTDKSDSLLTAFTASFNVLSGSTGQAKLIIVGGGASGGSGGSPAADFTAGGGGGGGVVYYNQFPLSSGSYEIGIARAVAPVGGTIGANGNDSYFKLPQGRTYTPFTNEFLRAYGGGGGGRGTLDLVAPITCQTTYGGAKATSGGMGVYVGDQCRNAFYVPSDVLYDNLGGINYGPQGYRGGILEGTYSDFSAFSATGGGGAGGSGSFLSKNDQAFGLYASDGGPGFGVNMTGSYTYFGPGGGGQAGGDTGSPGAGGVDAYGRGGQGERDNVHTSINYGNAGVVIITIPKCNTDLKVCTEYRISGGATGGTMTYIPCGTDDITSASIDFGFTGSICTFKVGPYPSSTGTVTLTQTGSCNTFIPLQPTVTCTGGQVKTPVYLWEYTLTGTCYPTPSSCQRYSYGNRILNYVDVNGVSQSVNVGLFFANTSTVTGQVCARSLPVPTLNGSPLTNETSLICGYYCSGSI